MSNNIKLETGKKYLTRDGRVANVKDFFRGRAYAFRGDVEGLLNYEECWTREGRWAGLRDHQLDLVSEYVETPSEYQRIAGLLDKHVAPAQPGPYRYFRFPERDDEARRDVCVWRHAPGETYGTAKYIYRETDEWEDTGLTLEDNRRDPDMIECDEDGVPLSPPQAPEPRIPEGFIEVTRTYPSFTPEARASVLIRVSDIASVHAHTDGCTIGTTSGHRDYSVTESYTTVLEKINAALP